MTDPALIPALAVATRRLLRVATLFGLTASLVALVVTLQQRSRLATVILATGWSVGWAIVATWPQLVIPLRRRWRWTTVLVAAVSAGTILSSGGFSSLLKTEADWLGLSRREVVR